jgi:predicted transcriptional regulator
MRSSDKSRVHLASSEGVRNINRRIVLNLIRTKQPISRADLARVSGLQRSTISLIVEDLIEGHWVIEGATGRLPRGRRPTFLRLNDDRVIIGVDIRPLQITVAMAYDQRFWIAYVSSSGEGGVKLHRRNWGELENVAGTSEYHWMTGNFLKYAGPLNWNDLPVDSHELVALCAPRPVFISAGAGSFLAAVGAGPVYELLGKKDLGTTEFPPVETPLIDGDIAFRQHSGGHTPGPNWPTFLKFAESKPTF